MFSNEFLKLQSCNMQQTQHKGVDIYHTYEYKLYYGSILKTSKYWFIEQILLTCVKMP